MKRAFFVLVVADVLALSLPTAWMGYRLEVAMAVTLTFLTGLMWFLIRVRQDEF